MTGSATGIKRLSTAKIAMVVKVCQRRKFLLFILFIALYGIPDNGFSQSSKWEEYAVQGDTLYARQDYEDAIKLYSKAISKSKLKDKAAYRTVYKRAVCYFSTQQYPEALKDVDLFSTEYPNVPQASLLKAFIFRELDDDDQQLANLQAAMDSEEPSADLLKWRSLLFMKKDEYQKAKEDLQVARTFEDDAEIETFLGLCYYNLHVQDSAFISFNRSIEIDATYVPAYLYVGSLALEEGNYELSLQYANLALRVEPASKEALFYKGIALVEMHQLDEGCRCLNRAFYGGMDDAGDYLEEYCFGNDR